MSDRRQRPLEVTATVGAVSTRLVLYCVPCRDTLERTIPGACLRVNGRAVVLAGTNASRARLQEPCPRCGHPVFLGEDLRDL
jgi:hypothetical protein